MRKKVYKIKKTSKLIKKLKPYLTELQLIEDKFYSKIDILEKKMSKELKIKGFEFFWVDNSIVGIGNIDRTMDLIHREEIEEGKVDKDL